MLQAATGTIVPTASVPDEMRSGGVMTDSMMPGEYSRRIGITLCEHTRSPAASAHAGFELCRKLNRDEGIIPSV